ncbi:MAG: hypothetical protein ACOX4N_00215 [Dethiobacteraceae bacterium]|jgi:hypothetical protein
MSRKANIQITERDKRIMIHLYRARLLTGVQIRALYFNGSAMVHRRLPKLIKYGYIKYGAYFEPIPGHPGRTRKVGHYYYLDSKGIDLLTELGYITEKTYPSRLLPRDKDIEFHIELGDLYKLLVTENIITPEEWQYGKEVKEIINARKYAPLFAVAKDLYIFRAVYNIPPASIKTIIDIAKELPRSVILCADSSVQDRILEKYLYGNIHIILMRDMFKVIPLMLKHPNGHLNLLLSTIDKYGEDTEIIERAPHYAHLQVGVDTLLAADLATGSAPALIQARKFKGDFRFYSAIDRTQLQDYPIPEDLTNIVFLDGSETRVYLNDNQVIEEGA